MKPEILFYEVSDGQILVAYGDEFISREANIRLVEFLNGPDQKDLRDRCSDVVKNIQQGAENMNPTESVVLHQGRKYLAKRSRVQNPNSDVPSMLISFTPHEDEPKEPDEDKSDELTPGWDDTSGEPDETEDGENWDK